MPTLDDPLSLDEFRSLIINILMHHDLNKEEWELLERHIFHSPGGNQDIIDCIQESNGFFFLPKDFLL
jgi:hypothetical protein